MVLALNTQISGQHWAGNLFVRIAKNIAENFSPNFIVRNLSTYNCLT